MLPARSMHTAITDIAASMLDVVIGALLSAILDYIDLP